MIEDSQNYEEVIAKGTANTTVDNVVEAIRFFANILRGHQESRKKFEDIMEQNKVTPRMDGVQMTIKMVALTFLVHFVGDAHQPLHVGRGGDLGGNKVAVNWFGELSNLHKVWDEGLIESEHLSFSEYARFIDHPTQEDIKSWQSAAVDEWAKESIALRYQVYEIWAQTSRTNHLPDLSYQYAYNNVPVIKQRLVQAGVRLAGLLNAIFK